MSKKQKSKPITSLMYELGQNYYGRGHLPYSLYTAYNFLLFLNKNEKQIILTSTVILNYFIWIK